MELAERHGRRRAAAVEPAVTDIRRPRRRGGRRGNCFHYGGRRACFHELLGDRVSATGGGGGSGGNSGSGTANGGNGGAGNTATRRSPALHPIALRSPSRTPNGPRGGNGGNNGGGTGTGGIGATVL